jgi:hypothetical protein|tara:strand:+ start:176 stop:847 length:672 start_codon:yes stop_codon:yes gene_type:complete
MAYHKTKEELESDNNWHFIELTNMPINVPKLIKWHNTVLETMPHLRFGMDRTDLVKTGILKNMLIGSMHSFGLSWPVEQDLPIPPKYAARPNLYPETLVDDFVFGSQMKVMERYKFGYFKELFDLYGEDFLSWSRITIHDAGAKIDPHEDTEVGSSMYRIHIPIITNEDAMFYWGETGYNLKVGKAYLINTSITHNTHNKGSITRSHLIAHPANVEWILENLV